MYLTHFGFCQYPFHLTPNTELFLGLAPHYEAIQTVNSALAMGEGVITVTGEVGTGKTMVCRMLMSLFSEQIQLVYLPNPCLSDQELRQAIAKELEIVGSDTISVVDDIQQCLVALHRQQKQVVVLVDEAQALPDSAIEALRLFGNLETAQDKLMHIVLFGQPELDQRLAQHHLRQFRQRISFRAQLRPLTLQETVAYIDSRLMQSGGDERIFSLNHKRAVWRASGGIPRLINQVCHKALLMTYSAQQSRVGSERLFEAIHDTLDTYKPRFRRPLLWGWSHP